MPPPGPGLIPMSKSGFNEVLFRLFVQPGMDRSISKQVEDELVGSNPKEPNRCRIQHVNMRIDIYKI